MTTLVIKIPMATYWIRLKVQAKPRLSEKLVHKKLNIVADLEISKRGVQPQ